MMKLLIPLIALALGACSTDPYDFDYEQGGTVLRALPAGDDAATVTFRHEPSSWLGSLTSDVKGTIDGAPIVDLDQGEELSIKVPPGDYIIGSRCEAGLQTLVNEREARFAAGKTYAYRIYQAPADGCQIAPMSVTYGSL